ncbi:DUF4037 domain-containing protein [Nonomuraea africana]|uniref:DUF4037 domain-containing protein n=1 Tax=Nonomuraea africana TaxID=46171 RepID=A0ABR9KCF9_9ACTN|nr:DUF4037 domain-containing protein [Nonomuraea africana]MBE1559697.1 hypothetical protein [Nonomuraea africana]
MSGFVPGLELSRAYYADVVAPLVADIPHSAALVGPGSEVLAFDTQRSADHDWGPRVLLFVAPGAVAAVEAAVAAGLPPSFGGYPTVFVQRGELRHGVLVAELGAWLRERLGFDPREQITALDWLSAPWQALAEVTCGEVFHDGLGELNEVRAALRWYPEDLWRYVLACQWQRIGQEESFPGRCAEVGDELGSATLGGRMAREVMRLALLQRRRYPPYAKWLGSALARLPGAAELGEALGAALAARTWPERERALSAAYERLAAVHNRIALTDPVETAVRPFHDRPFQVIDGGRLAETLLESIRDPAVRALPLTGSIDQMCDSVEVLTHPARARAVTAAALTLQRAAA